VLKGKNIFWITGVKLVPENCLSHNSEIHRASSRENIMQKQAKKENLFLSCARTLPITYDHIKRVRPQGKVRLG